MGSSTFVIARLATHIFFFFSACLGLVHFFAFNLFMDPLLLGGAFLFGGLSNEDVDHYLRTQTIAAGYVIHGTMDLRQARRNHRQKGRRYLVRPNLIPNPRGVTGWTALRDSRDDRAYLTCMGVDCDTFDYLLDMGFRDLWNSHTIPRDDVATAGAPRIDRRSLDAEGGLGLVLHYMSSPMREKSLQQIFAIIPSSTSRYINFSLQILDFTLQRIPDAFIMWPRTLDEYEFLSDLIEDKYPRLRGGFGFIDGLKLPLGVSSDPDWENATYNGWLHDHFIGCVFAFSPQGRLDSISILLLKR
jgi:hypothetical protein